MICKKKFKLINKYTTKRINILIYILFIIKNIINKQF